MRHFSFSEEPNQDWIWTEITEAAQFTWSLAEQIEILYCTCLKSCTCLNLAMASADNPKPLDFSPGLPIPLSGRPIFLLPQSNILILHNHNSYSFLLSCKLSQISFILPLSFLPFPSSASIPYHLIPEPAQSSAAHLLKMFTLSGCFSPPSLQMSQH